MIDKKIFNKKLKALESLVAKESNDSKWRDNFNKLESDLRDYLSNSQPIELDVYWDELLHDRQPILTRCYRDMGSDYTHVEFYISDLPGFSRQPIARWRIKGKMLDLVSTIGLGTGSVVLAEKYMMEITGLTNQDTYHGYTIKELYHKAVGVANSWSSGAISEDNGHKELVKINDFIRKCHIFYVDAKGNNNHMVYKYDKFTKLRHISLCYRLKDVFKICKDRDETVAEWRIYDNDGDIHAELLESYGIGSKALAHVETQITELLDINIKETRGLV